MPTNTSKPELTPEQKAEKELVAMANQTAKNSALLPKAKSFLFYTNHSALNNW